MNAKEKTVTSLLVDGESSLSVKIRVLGTRVKMMLLAQIKSKDDPLSCINVSLQQRQSLLGLS